MARTATVTATRTATLTAWRDIDLSRMRLEETGSDGFKRSWIMLMPEGEFDHPQYGKLAFSREKLSEFKRNFDNRVRRIDIALDRDHDGGQATGWLEELALRDGGLWGLVRWTKLGEQLLSDQIYRYFSPEFGTFTDPETGKKFSNVIIGGGLTNRPFLKSMPAVKLSEISRRSWASVDKAKLPASCFLIVGDRAKKTTWRLPVYEGAGAIGADGMYTRRGPLNINGVRAALDAIGGARTGTPMSGVPSGLRAKLEGWLKRYGSGGDSAASASEGAGAVATRKSMGAGKSRMLADSEPARDEQEQLDEEARLDDTEAEDAEAEAEAEVDELDEDLDEDLDDEELDESASDDASEEADEEGADDEQPRLAEKSGRKMAAKKPFPGAAAPFGKGGKKKPAPANDAEDAADGGADEDEELDDMDVEYDEADGDGPGPKGKGKGKGKMPMAMTRRASSRKAASEGQQAGSAARRMTEPQLLAENARLREENQRLREEQFGFEVRKQLAEFTRNIRAADEDGEYAAFALPRSFKRQYQTWMLGNGLRLSEDQRDGLNALIQTALAVGTVPLTSLANQIERGEVVDGDDRRPRATLNEVDRTAEAEKIALAEFKKPLDELEMDDRLSIYLRLESAAQRRGAPAA